MLFAILLALGSSTGIAAEPSFACEVAAKRVAIEILRQVKGAYPNRTTVGETQMAMRVVDTLNPKACPQIMRAPQETVSAYVANKLAKEEWFTP